MPEQKIVMSVQNDGGEPLRRLWLWLAGDEDRVVRLGLLLFIAVCAALLRLT